MKITVYIIIFLFSFSLVKDAIALDLKGRRQSNNVTDLRGASSPQATVVDALQEIKKSYGGVDEAYQIVAQNAPIIIESINKVESSRKSAIIGKVKEGAKLLKSKRDSLSNKKSQSMNYFNNTLLPSLQEMQNMGEEKLNAASSQSEAARLFGVLDSKMEKFNAILEENLELLEPLNSKNEPGANKATKAYKDELDIEIQTFNVSFSKNPSAKNSLSTSTDASNKLHEFSNLSDYFHRALVEHTTAIKDAIKIAKDTQAQLRAVAAEAMFRKKNTESLKK